MKQEKSKSQLFIFAVIFYSAISIVGCNGDGGGATTNDGDGGGTVGGGSPTSDFPFFDVGRSPSSVAMGDLNEDGVLDIVTTNSGSDDISVLLGKEGGSFIAEKRFSVGTFPNSVAIGDLNGDGKLDVVIGALGLSSVLLGQGDGTFGTERKLIEGTSHQSVAIGDLNENGVLDIVTRNEFSDDISIFLGQGDGTFGTEKRFTVGDKPSSTGFHLPNSVVVRDLDGDGMSDIVTANKRDNNVSVLLGQGNGTFGAEKRFAVGSSPSSVAIGDLNGDNVLDLVTVNRDSVDVSVLLGQGDGTFGTGKHFIVGESPASIALGDLDGDNILDLVTVVSSSKRISVLLGEGDGTFGATRRMAAANDPELVVLGNMDKDGVLDLVAVHSTGQVSVALGTGDGGFRILGSFEFEVFDITGEYDMAAEYSAFTLIDHGNCPCLFKESNIFNTIPIQQEGETLIFPRGSVIVSEVIMVGQLLIGAAPGGSQRFVGRINSNGSITGSIRGTIMVPPPLSSSTGRPELAKIFDGSFTLLKRRP